METIIGEELKVRDINESVYEGVCELSERSTQCFMCSRIYFGEDLRQCPRCGSRSVECYKTGDFAHFARNSAR